MSFVDVVPCHPHRPSGLEELLLLDSCELTALQILPAAKNVYLTQGHLCQRSQSASNDWCVSSWDKSEEQLCGINGINT